MRPRAVAIALLAGLIGLGWARVQHFNIETNTISVKEPADAAGEYQAAIGDFGVPLYGGTLMGRVEVHRDNTDGCKNFTAVPPPSGDLPRIFLVDRGGRTPTGRTCYFVLKAWHAQLAGAKALIVADHTQEELVTMSVPFEHPEVADLIEKINIPVVLVTKDTGSKFKRAVGDDGKGNLVLELNWKESMTHPDDRVEWEMFFSTNNGCGELCASQTTFLLNFRGTAVSLERENHTQFTPHILTRPCYSWEPASSDRCQRDCIHGGRYCAWESVASQFQDKYHGAQVVEENKRHICVFQHVSKAGRPWAWWDFAARFASQCTMAAGRYDKACAEEMMRASNIDPVPVADCMGDIHENSFSPILEAEFRAQHDSTGVGYGDVIMLPTIIINSDQYRGRLDAPSVLRALCAGYKEGTEPPVCLTGGLNVDECSTGKHDCWQGPAGESACMDTFRGYICHCPPGWEGDGHVCQDIDECAMHIDGCDHECVNTPGSYYCKCNRGYKLHGGQGSPGICVPSTFKSGLPVWGLLIIIGGTLAIMTATGIGVYKWRLRNEMQTEIRSIMREYMPLENQEQGDSRQRLLPHPSVGGGGGKLGAGEGGGDKEHYFRPTGPPLSSEVSLSGFAQSTPPRTY